MYDSQTDKLILIDQKLKLDQKLKSLTYGAIEIRERSQAKYIYVHYRDEGKQQTNYVGEYSDELYQAILNNNIEAKKIKKALRETIKKLKLMNYMSQTLSPSVEVNIDFARKNMVDFIYKQSVLEGIATTYADTETIIEGGNINDMSADDVHKIINLKHAWQFILNHDVITADTNYSLLCEINKLVIEGFYYNAGRVRSVPVSISGTAWKPPLPLESEIKDEMESILKSNLSVIEKAIEYLLYIMKRQIFIDGNKRTSIIFANHLLVSHGLGIIVVPREKIARFKDLLIAYYEGKDVIDIKQFLLNDCYYKLN